MRAYEMNINEMNIMNTITLQGADLLFANIAQGATVTEATLPSGFKVPKPKSADDDWIVFGNSLVLVNKINPFKQPE